MTDNTHSKLLILGSGPAGYTAAIYASRAMLEPTLLTGIEPGGQMTITTDVENYPGFADIIQGPWLMDQMKDQAKAVGTEMIEDHIASVNLKSKPKALASPSTWLIMPCMPSVNNKPFNLVINHYIAFI